MRVTFPTDESIAIVWAISNQVFHYLNGECIISGGGGYAKYMGHMKGRAAYQVKSGDWGGNPGAS